MHVPYNYLPQEFADVEEIFKNWKILINSSEFTLGPFIEKWEKTFAKFVGAKYCVSTNNGTDALILSLKALGVGQGDEVITVTNTFYATVGAIVAVGATAVLVDSDDRFQINIDTIEDFITSKTKAIIPVHWAGASPNMLKIKEISVKYGLKIVEDACMGIGGMIQKQHPGTFGELGAFSMHPLKSLNALGDGGMVVTDDEKLFRWMLKYRNHGMIDRNHIEFWGENFRLQPLQAVVAQVGLKKLNNTIKKRNENAYRFDENLNLLKQFIKIPTRNKENLETFSLYMGLFKDRDNLMKFLISNNIDVKVHYPIPLHKQEAAKYNCIFNSEKLKNSEYQANHLLTLPVHQFLSTEQIDYTINKIYQFYGKSY